MIFVDTGAWFAANVPDDADYQAASEFLSINRERLVTTDYVVDELLTLLRARGESDRALVVGERLLEHRVCRLEIVDESDMMAAWNVFRRFADKEWSFTDCVSYVAIARLRIKTAFAFDVHFRQFGTVQVLP